MSYLNYNTRKRVSMDIAKTAVKNKTFISTAAHVNCLFEFIAPIIQDQEDQPSLEDLDMEDFEEEQQLVAALVHLFINEDLREQSAVRIIKSIFIKIIFIFIFIRCMLLLENILQVLVLL